MRTTLSVLLAALALALLVPAAGAATIVSVEGSFTKSGGKTTMNVAGTQRNEDGSQPPTVASLDLWLPSQLRINLMGLRKCSRARLQAGGAAACPRASRIGTGSATAVWGSMSAVPTLALVYGGENRIHMLVRASTPFAINRVITAELAGTGGLYSLLMTIPVPEWLQAIDGQAAAVTQIGSSVGAMLTYRGRRRSFLRLASCGPSGAYAFKAVMTLAGGRTQEATSTSACA